MIENCSEAFMLIENLYNAAVHHSETCNTSECNVSVFRLKLAARKIMNYQNFSLSQKEYEQINEWFGKWPI